MKGVSAYCEKWSIVKLQRWSFSLSRKVILFYFWVVFFVTHYLYCVHFSFLYLFQSVWVLSDDFLSSFLSVCFRFGHQRHVSQCVGGNCVSVVCYCSMLTSCLSVAAHSVSLFDFFFFFFNFLFLLSLSASLSEYPSSISSPFPDLIQVQTLNEQEWERMQQANVLANVAQAFESDMDASDLEEDRETIFSSVDLLSPGGQADAQTLALMLQEQLDAINNEIRYQQLHQNLIYLRPQPLIIFIVQ